MRPRWYRASAVSLGLVIVAGIVYGYLRAASALDSSPWISTAAPLLTKIVDLPDNTELDSRNTDCVREQYVANKITPAETICTFASPLGELTIDGRIRVGDNKLAHLYGPNNQSVFMASADASITVLSLAAPTIGNNVGIYRHLTKSSLVQNMGGEGAYYNIPAMPDELIKNPLTGQPLQIDTYNAAFSSNGEWMLADVPHDGLVRIHMTDLSVQLFAAPLEPQWYLGLASPPLAISNDGRYAAANADIFSRANLSVYDLSTCSDQMNVASGERKYCAGKNIWQGKTLAGQQMGDGIVAQLPSLRSAVHLRFIDDDTVTFSAIYDASGTSYKAANFAVTAPGTVQHRLGLLGMGDSYISGQGAFDYREGTDTPNNGCHLSELAYPFLLGKESFNSYNSIACSGAVTSDVIGAEQTYQGQVKDKIREDKRDKNSILATFLPGYIYQQEFAATYKPEAIILSVGGDDIGFAKIVNQCVANQGGGTCYDTYEDRVELLQEINRTYPKLVNTYTKLREQSGGARIYVVGYPQIAKEGGDCGLNVHLNANEIQFSTQLIDYLDGVIQKAAATAGVFYVDTTHALDGHRLCETNKKQSGMNGFTVGQDGGVTIRGRTINFIGTESYHPTKLGYELLAQTISHQTAKLSIAMPRPGAFVVPELDSAAPILQGVPHEERPLNSSYHDSTMSSDVAQAGDVLDIAASGTQAVLKPGAAYQAVLHSTPIILGTGLVNDAGNVATTVEIPETIPAGYHTLHIYSTNLAGQPVDIQKPLYIFPHAQAEDIGGGSCVLFAASGQDDDRDGVDDACDPEIDELPATAARVAISTPATSGNAELNVPAPVQEGGADKMTSAGSVLGAVTPAPVDQPTQDDTITLNAAVPDLARVHWLTVLLAGVVITGLLTIGYYYLR